MTDSLLETHAPLRGSNRLFTTVPNGITAVRTFVSVPMGAFALVESSVSLLVLAYAIYWVGDIADGWSARRLKQETRVGAVLDIVCDRACTSVLCAGLIVMYPEGTPALIVFLITFMVIDTMLSLSFLAWEILGPNYFDSVDDWVYRWNWSPTAKAGNTSLVVIAVIIGWNGAALAVALFWLAVKLRSIGRVADLLGDRT